MNQVQHRGKGIDGQQRKEVECQQADQHIQSCSKQTAPRAAKGRPYSQIAKEHHGKRHGQHVRRLYPLVTDDFDSLHKKCDNQDHGKHQHTARGRQHEYDQQPFHRCVGREPFQIPGQQEQHCNRQTDHHPEKRNAAPERPGIMYHDPCKYTK